MRSRAGYSLVHMLAAIAVIGLTAGATAQGMASLARQQGRATETVAAYRSERAIQLAVAETFQEARDYSSLSGGGGYVRVDCPGGSCEANILSSRGAFVLSLRTPGQPARTLVLPGPAGFRFFSGTEVSDRWPTARPYPGLTGMSLELTGEGESRPLAFLSATLRQPRDCEYDAVIRDCREVYPVAFND
jgi:type II secretory pathway pseudopilin PulG